MYRINYWSDSALADWVRSSVGMSRSICDNTKQWELEFKTKYPIVYNITENWIDRVQDFLLLPYDLYDRFMTYYNNRWVNQLHLLDTKLPKGKWHELDTRLLHGAFELLVDFVEVDKAYAYKIMNNYMHRNTHERSSELGVKYLEWEMSSQNDNATTDPSTNQSVAATEQYELYKWWTVTRPNRPNPYDLSGWNEYEQNNLNKLDYFASITPEEKVLLNKAEQIDTAYYNEDTEMLVRLMNIRSTLWT